MTRLPPNSRCWLDRDERIRRGSPSEHRPLPWPGPRAVAGSVRRWLERGDEQCVATASTTRRPTPTRAHVGSSRLSRPTAERGEQHEPAERERDQQLPAEVHQLVVAQAGQRGPEPHVHVQEHAAPSAGTRRCRRAAPEERRDVRRCRRCAMRLRAAEEQRDDDAAHRDRVHELGEEEQGEPDAGVLGVEAADELLLGLDEVERRAVQLGRGGDQEDRRTARRRWRRRSSRRSCSARRRCRWCDSVPAISMTAARLRPSAAS